jgi:hypothetical protein
VTVLPASAGAGVYVNVKGETLTVVGETEPAPSSEIITEVAFPPKVFPFNVTGDMPQPLPVLLPNTSVGSFTHPHDTEKEVPVVVQPAEFRTVMI